MMLLVFVILTLTILNRGLGIFNVVVLCPESGKRWQTRAMIYGCITGKKYHCMMSLNGSLIETCLDVLIIYKPGGIISSFPSFISVY